MIGKTDTLSPLPIVIARLEVGKSLEPFVSEIGLGELVGEVVHGIEGKSQKKWSSSMLSDKRPCLITEQLRGKSFDVDFFPL